MHHHIKSVDDLRWFITHTGGFRSGYVTDVQMSKRRLFDEGSGREVPAGTTVSVTIRYQVRGMIRLAKLTMIGVTDFSLFEQEGADCSALDIIQAEYGGGRFRFWFDPQGELYIVCEELRFQEVSTPIVTSHPITELARWTFQGQTADGPTVQWLLNQLDTSGIPCSWKPTKRTSAIHPAIAWEGDLIPARDALSSSSSMVHVMAYGPLEGQGFGLMLRILGAQDRQVRHILEVLTEQITRHFAGHCLVGTTIIPGHEWESWVTQDNRSKRV
jgi:hypothetical protein